MKRISLLVGVLSLACFALWLRAPGDADTGKESPRFALLGSAENLQAQYEEWKEGIELAGGGDAYVLGLNWTKGVSTEYSEASGDIRIDLANDAVSVNVAGLPDDERLLDLWIVDNSDVPTSTVLPETGDPMIHVGTLDVEGGYGTLEASIADAERGKFEIDLVLLSPQGETPLESAVLAGSPSLFQRLYAMEHQHSSPSMLALAVVAQSGGVATGFPNVFNDLISQGEDTFFNQTFNGNGRTCGTCHLATSNFTITVEDMAQLPNNDPLFSAEFVPALIFGDPANLDANGDPQRFENPALMRAFGLIVENQDGMGDLENRFNMRGVPHNIGMSVSITPTPRKSTPPFPFATLTITPPDDKTGWSGEGAPAGMALGIMTSGRLRDFMVGAIGQHFPKTLARDFTGPTPDFRAPTMSELDGVEAFLLSLGRQADLDLTTLVLRNADAEAGKVLFRDGNAASGIQCGACHENAGANAPGPPGLFGPGNQNFDTGVEEFLRNRIDDPTFTVVGEPRPVDGGFGTNPAGDFSSLVAGPGNGNENFGDGQFNTPSVVEAADTAPFFHNNSAFTVEDTIRFYNSPEFIASIGLAIPFDDTEVDQVAAFMRVINAVDNLENFSRVRAQRAQQALAASPNDEAVINFLIDVACADLDDAGDVLRDSNLHFGARLAIGLARVYSNIARIPFFSDGTRTFFLDVSILFMDIAVHDMVE